MGQVIPSDMTTAASNADDAARTVRNHIPDEVAGVAAAMEGGTAGAAGTAVGDAWTTAYTSWATDIEAYADTLRSIALAWQDTDDASGQSFRNIPVAF